MLLTTVAVHDILLRTLSGIMGNLLKRQALSWREATGVVCAVLSRLSRLRRELFASPTKRSYLQTTTNQGRWATREYSTVPVSYQDVGFIVPLQAIPRTLRCSIAAVGAPWRRFAFQSRLILSASCVESYSRTRSIHLTSAIGDTYNAPPRPWPESMHAISSSRRAVLSFATPRPPGVST